MVRAAAVQLSPVLYSREGTTEKVLKAIADAAQKGVQLMVFPETLYSLLPLFLLCPASSADGQGTYDAV